MAGRAQRVKLTSVQIACSWIATGQATSCKDREMALSSDDFLAVQQLYARYNHAIDFGSAAEWADCFMPDGTLDAGQGGELTVGRDALLEFHSITRQFVPDIRHVVNNLVLDGDATTATGGAYLHVTGGTGADRTTLTIGRYEDELRNDGGGWRFASRRLIAD